MANVPKLDLIVAAVKARLAVPNGAGIYWLNTSAAGQVIEALIPMDMLPSGCPLPLWQVTPVNAGDTIDGPTTNHYLRHGVIPIIGYVAAATATVEARIQAARRMFQDGCLTLESEMTLGGLVQNPIVRNWYIDALEFDGSGSVGNVMFEFHFDFRTAIGTGL